MSRIIGIVGDTGVGKSSAIQYLDHKETYVINVAGKGLPFKGSNKIYNLENKNYAEIDDALEVLKRLELVSAKAPHIKTIIIEDGSYLMGFNMVNRATETGYTKFSLMAQSMKNLIQGAKKLRDDLLVVYFSHQDELTDTGEIVKYKMKTSGQLIEKEIKMEGLFTELLYAIAEEEKGDKVGYYFVTNKYGKYPAKTPMGMFKDVKIPNNLKIVKQAIDEYYS